MRGLMDQYSRQSCADGDRNIDDSACQQLEGEGIGEGEGEPSPDGDFLVMYSSNTESFMSHGVNADFYTSSQSSASAPTPINYDYSGCDVDFTASTMPTVTPSGNTMSIAYHNQQPHPSYPENTKNLESHCESATSPMYGYRPSVPNLFPTIQPHVSPLNDDDLHTSTPGNYLRSSSTGFGNNPLLVQNELPHRRYIGPLLRTKVPFVECGNLPNTAVSPQFVPYSGHSNFPYNLPIRQLDFNYPPFRNCAADQKAIATGGLRVVSEGDGGAFLRWKILQENVSPMKNVYPGAPSLDNTWALPNSMTAKSQVPYFHGISQPPYNFMESSAPSPRSQLSQFQHPFAAAPQPAGSRLSNNLVSSYQAAVTNLQTTEHYLGNYQQMFTSTGLDLHNHMVGSSDTPELAYSFDVAQERQYSVTQNTDFEYDPLNTIENYDCTPDSAGANLRFRLPEDLTEMLSDPANPARLSQESPLDQQFSYNNVASQDFTLNGISVEARNTTHDIQGDLEGGSFQAGGIYIPLEHSQDANTPNPCINLKASSPKPRRSNIGVIRTGKKRPGCERISPIKGNRTPEDRKVMKKLGGSCTRCHNQKSSCSTEIICKPCMQVAKGRESIAQRICCRKEKSLTMFRDDIPDMLDVRMIILLGLKSGVEWLPSDLLNNVPTPPSRTMLLGHPSTVCIVGNKKISLKLKDSIKVNIYECRGDPLEWELVLPQRVSRDVREAYNSQLAKPSCAMTLDSIPSGKALEDWGRRGILFDGILQEKKMSPNSLEAVIDTFLTFFVNCHRSSAVHEIAESTLMIMSLGRYQDERRPIAKSYTSETVSDAGNDLVTSLPYEVRSQLFVMATVSIERQERKILQYIDREYSQGHGPNCEDAVTLGLCTRRLGLHYRRIMGRYKRFSASEPTMARRFTKAKLMYDNLTLAYCRVNSADTTPYRNGWRASDHLAAFGNNNRLAEMFEKVKMSERQHSTEQLDDDDDGVYIATFLDRRGKGKTPSLKTQWAKAT